MILNWPDNIPCERKPCDYWLWDDVREGLDKLVNGSTRCYCELGSWCGASARYVAERAKHATIWCIDTWDGRGLEQHPDADKCLQLFQANLWPYRDRVFMIQARTTDGVLEVCQVPDVIYIDAEHTQAAVSADLAACQMLWPTAIICGDDYNVAGVQQALSHYKIEIGRCSMFWRLRHA